MRLCKDKNCERLGIALNDSEFSRNAVYADQKHIYCRQCNARKAADYRWTIKVLASRTKVKLPASVSK